MNSLSNPRRKSGGVLLVQWLSCMPSSREPAARVREFAHKSLAEHENLSSVSAPDGCTRLFAVVERRSNQIDSSG